MGANDLGALGVIAVLTASTIGAYTMMHVLTPRRTVPRTMSKEWKEAEKEYRIAQNQNPIFGYASKFQKWD
ncbi:Cytochrome c oxidase subunit IV [Plasmodiophora brassicae]|uniref:Uncharacterized protein n=1 Tax=Plasmodiophora brassicae TaxID=37360 RepID=A0A0G4IXT4_PLABS|nr:hypothetical protein PBRA_007616 [Plasmodiophora brassicae]SPQ99515.1 unnamed protein product [Plasmodiophora brassicae]